MICPSCSYEDGYSYTEHAIVRGSEGEFFELPIKLEREGQYSPVERKNVMGCPKCNAVFMED